MVKAVNVLKVISAIVFLVTLLFVYALLPVMVNVNPEEVGWSFHKEYFFYGLLIVFLLLNIFTYAVDKMLSPVIKSEEIKSWVRSISFVLNLYMAFLVGYVGVLNNPTTFQPGAYSYLNYLGPILVIGWVIGLIFLIFNRPKTA